MYKRVESWPDDADGEVLRLLAENGFDFSAEVPIEFNVDVEEWPPGEAMLVALRKHYDDVECVEAEDGDRFVQFVVTARVSYELVTSVQRAATELAAPFGGWCDSWAALA
jgi:hypothetical protein